MHPKSLSLYHAIYPVKEEPIAKRDRPLQVLCLGLCRCGTDSLRNALLELGYFDVHHGYRLLDRPGEILQWLRIAHFKQTGQHDKITAHEFDKCIGDCQALTDIASGFAQELLTAYPDTKVVLNYRENVDAWHASVKKTLDVMETSRVLAVAAYFQKVLFWQRQAVLYIWRDSHGGNFGRDGRAWYHRHYEGLEKRLKAEKRGYLNWKVEDGWEPLCEYLEKSVPDTPFPSGNNPAAFQARLDKTNRALMIEVGRNMLVSLAFVVGLSTWAYVKFIR